MLVKWNHPVSPSFSRLLDDFFNSDLRVTKGFDTPRSVPNVNVVELEDKFRVEVAAPGLNKEDFHLDVDKDRLTIKAHTELKNEETTEKYTRREFSYQSFERSFALPETINREAIAAVYKDGVLNITLPKKVEATQAARLIEVK